MDFQSDFIIDGSFAARTDRHFLGGTAKENGAPAAKRIVIFLRADQSIVASTFSDAATGAWQISNINEYPIEALFAIAFDDSGTFNAEIADFVSQTTTQ